MKDFYICDAGQFENQVITSSFVVATKQVKPKKSGELYLALGEPAKAEEQLAALEDICLIPCEETGELKRAIAAYNKTASR